jgi:hypothetical protein
VSIRRTRGAPAKVGSMAQEIANVFAEVDVMLLELEMFVKR